jgi:hypothetical protein
MRQLYGPLYFTPVRQTDPALRVVLSRGQDLLREIPIRRPVMLVGRDPLCDVVIDDIAVSKRHMKFELAGEAIYAEDLDSKNGMRINGHAASRQAIHHLDVIEIGNHKMHVFDDSLLPPGDIVGQEGTVTVLERTPLVRVSAELQDTMPTASEATAHGPMLALERLDEESAPRVRLDQPNTMIGAGAASALLVWRRDRLYLTRLTREALRVNGRELGPGSYAVAPNDVIEVGSARYRVVAER